MTSPTMKRLLVSVAAAPLCLAAFQSANAQVSITTSQSSPLSTATANGGAASDIAITSTGSVGVSGGVAVTVNSNNSVNSSGSISSTPTSGGAGIVINDGMTSSISNSGAITIENTTTLNDTNNDGYPDSPFTTQSNQYGIHALGVATGTISDSGTIAVIGNNSAGIAIDGGLNGVLSHSGTMSVTGDNSYGIYVGTGGITGQTANVGNGYTESGSITVKGTNAVGADIKGSVDGQVSITGSISATGYSTTTVPVTYVPTADGSQNGGLTSADFGIGGQALRIEGNVGLNPGSAGSGGIVLSSSSSVFTYGPAEALGVGPASGSAEIGVVSTSTPYGIVMSGTVESDVLYANGPDSTAVKIGGYGGNVKIDGGIENTGTVAAVTYIANATAMLLGSGASTPTLLNTGTIGASVFAQGTYSATAIQINQGATLTNITNSGTIQATVSGLADNKNPVQGSAYAIVDKSGTLTSINNSGAITASVVVGNTDASIASSATRVAIDASANTTGVTLTQTGGGSITPSITGDVLLGNGNNTINLEAGTLTGDVTLGTGADSISLSNGAVETGALNKSGGTIALNLTGASTLDIRSANTLTASSLNVASGSQIVFSADPANNAHTQINVTGNANIATGTKIGLDFISKLPVGSTATYTLVDASKAASASLGAVTTGDVSWFYHANATTDTATNTINITAYRKSAAEAGVTSGAGAYEAVYAAFDKDPNIKNTFLTATTQASFNAAYQQMLPDYSGGVFQGLALGARTIAHADAETPVGVPDNGRRVWVQQLGWGNVSEQRTAPSFRDDGYALAAGWEKAFESVGTVGLSAAYMMFNMDQPDRQNGDHSAGSGFNGGIYWRDHLGYFKADASLNGGYVWLHSTRSFVGTTSAGASFTDQAVSNWNGYYGLAHAGLGWERLLISNVYIRPQVEGDFFYLSEEAHKETQGNSAFNLALDSRNGNQGSGTGGLAIGLRPMTAGSGFVWQPEVSIGYRELFGKGAGNTVGSFLSGGPSFSLAAEKLKDGGPTATISLRGGNRYSDLALEATGEERGGYYTYQGRFVFRFRF